MSNDNKGEIIFGALNIKEKFDNIDRSKICQKINVVSIY